ncbi:glycosyltransferase [Candidatus Altiarchaeota archaeon]
MEASIVIPTINEAENIRILIPMIEEIFTINNIQGQIIIVDDQSTDGTVQEAEELNKRYGNILVISRKVKDGLGNALKTGVSRAEYENIIFMDADLSHEPKEIPEFLKALKEYDVVVGSRYLEQSRLKRTLTRKIVSGSYNLISRNILGVKVSDLTSGYRGFKKTTFDRLDIESKGPEIHSELIVKASLAKEKVGEIPVTYVDRTHGQSKLNYMSIGPGYSKVILKALLSKASKFLK